MKNNIVPSAMAGFLMISCVIGHIKSNGISVWLDAILNNNVRTPAKWLSNVNLFVRSQIKTVRSFDPDANTDESLFIAKQLTYRECSTRVFKQFPCRSHSLTVLSILDENSIVPMGLNLENWNQYDKLILYFYCSKDIAILLLLLTHDKKNLYQLYYFGILV